MGSTALMMLTFAKKLISKISSTRLIVRILWASSSTVPMTATLKIDGQHTFSFDTKTAYLRSRRTVERQSAQMLPQPRQPLPGTDPRPFTRDTISAIAVSTRFSNTYLLSNATTLRCSRHLSVCFTSCKNVRKSSTCPSLFSNSTGITPATT
jgi:hypothetical protein